MSTRKTLTRRKFLALSAGTVASAVLAACGAPQSPTSAPTQVPKPAPTQAAGAQPTLVPTTPAKPTKFNEAPMLAELVKQGKLPPVEQRLPPEPLVVKPTSKVGKYGGTLRGAGMAPETTSDLQIGMVTGLFRFSDDLSQIYPEVAESYEFKNDNKTCVIKIRKGIRWSDGEPFTVDDIVFYFEDYQFNKDLTPTLPNEWQPGNQQMKVIKVDDYTVQFDFAVPNPAFALVHRSGAPIEPWRPKHWAKQFHIKYNPKADEEAKAAGFDNWVARFIKKVDSLGRGLHYGAMDPEMPVLAPWRTIKADSQRQVYERNPYYFKVDTEGNQLPYIDQVIVEYATDLEVMNLKAVSGELSVAGLDLLLVNYPVLKQGAEKGGYRVQMVYSERGADVAVALNQNHPDPVLKKIFNDVRFRQALSSAIDRNEINELVFLGQGVPRQATINESASFFKQEWADAYAKLDLDLANKLLDEMGLDRRGPDGVRLRPDGKPLAFQLEYLPHEGPKKEVCELLVRHWAKIGVKVDAQQRERSFLSTRLSAGQQDMSGWHVDRQLERASYAYGYTQKLGPGGDSAILYCKAWKDWFNSQGKQGVEPPQEAKDLFNAYQEWAQTTMGTPEYKAAATKVHDLIAKNLWVIGIVGEGPQPVVVKNDVKNVFPEDVVSGKRKYWWGAANWFWHSLHQEQWYLEG